MTFLFDDWVVTQPAYAKKLSEPTLFIGCMTGTSAEGEVDFTCAAFDEDQMPVAYRNMSQTMPDALQMKLSALSRQAAQTISIVERAEAEAALTHYLVDTFLNVIQAIGLSDYPKDKIILSPHGQAINHQPHEDPPYTDILLNGDVLAERTGYQVVWRHRQMPLAVSMAAPLAPVLIRKLFYSTTHHRVLLNGGGIANICVLLKDAPENMLGYDTGPANGPLDALVTFFLSERKHEIPTDLLQAISEKKCDVDGRWAARGKVIPSLFSQLLSHPYFARDSRAKSADRADFDLPWMMHWIQGQTLSCADILSTVSDVVAKTISDAIVQSIPFSEPTLGTEVVVYGGLAKNAYVLSRIQYYLAEAGHFYFSKMDQFGYDPDYFESLLMAYLGCCVVGYVPIDLTYCGRVPNKKVCAIPGSLARPASL